MGKRLRNRKNIIIKGVIIIIIISLFIFALFESEINITDENEQLKILVTGIDGNDKFARTDTIIVASLDKDTGAVGMLFIPRDTRVNIPESGINKINAANAIGGTGLLKDTIENFLSISIDYYINTDFNSFSKLINLIGGIKINIEEPMHYVDEAGDLYIDLPAGEQLLGGEEALNYVRYREETLGDIGRVQRQQKFVKALMEKVLQPQFLFELPNIFTRFNKTVSTDISLLEIVPFVNLVNNLDLHQVETKMVPGKPEYIDGISYWIPDKDKLEVLVENLIIDKNYLENNNYHVKIYNGNGKQGNARKLAGKLKKGGFNISGISNADHFDYENTIIRYNSNMKNEKQKAILRIKEILGENVELLEKNNTDDIMIIIGKNYIE